MKTALELLGDEAYVGMIRVHAARPLSSEATHTSEGWVRLLELVARRAREEAYDEIDAAAERIKDDLRDYVDASEALRRVRIAIRTIRALPTEPS